MHPFRPPKSSRSRSSPEKGFTLPELLVVLVILGLLAVMLLPARADSRTKSRSIRCLDNLRQIMGAVMMYTHDNHDLFPPNPDDGNLIPGHNWCPGLAGAGFGQNAEFDPDLIANGCLLMPYLNTNVSLFRCTADLRAGTYQGTDPAKTGTKVLAARSISMNGAVGTICPTFDSGTGHSGRPTLSVNDPWLNNIPPNKRNSPFRTYGKVSETVIPGPARLWVMIEEDVNSLKDASFAMGNMAEWVDWPATRHAMSCNVAFADGHVELHKWVNRSTLIPTPIARRSVPGADWTWLMERTSARAQ